MNFSDILITTTPNRAHVFKISTVMDRTTLLLLHRKTYATRESGTMHMSTDGVAVWLTDCAPYWVILMVCRLLGDSLLIVHADGCREWRMNGVLHRLHGPAIIRKDGTQEWFLNGKQHREGDVPAIIRADGALFWCQNGQLHRNGDAPAFIDASGTQIWYRHGERHRDGDSPAYIDTSGIQEWWRHGVRHRDGNAPARIRADGMQEWWKNGSRTWALW